MSSALSIVVGSLLAAALGVPRPVHAAPSAKSSPADDPSAAVRDAMADYEAGRLDAAIAAWEAALPRLAPASRLEVRARIGNAHRKLGHLEVAERLFAEVLAVAVDDHDSGLEALVRHYRGRLAIDRGDTVVAAAELSQAEAIFAQRRDAAQLRAVRTSLAGVQFLNAAIGPAYDTYTRLLEEARQVEDTRTEALALEGLGDCLGVVGEHALAMGLLAQAEALYRGAGDVARVAGCQARRAVADFSHGEVKGAQAWASAILADPASPSMWRVQATGILATAEFHAGRALAAAQSVDRHARSLADPDAGAAATVAFVTAAEFWLAIGELATAGAWLERVSQRTLSPLHRISYDKVLGALRLRKGDVQGALGPLDRIHKLESRFFEEFQPELHDFVSSSLLLDSTGTLYAAAISRSGTAAAALQAVGQVKARGTYEVLSTARTLLPAGDLLALVDVGKTRLGQARRVLGVAAPLSEPGEPTGFPAIREGQVVALEYLVTDTQLETFFVTAKGVERRPVAISGAALAADTLALEAALTHARADWAVPARRLSTVLLAPWAKELTAAAGRGARLLIVPHGVLHRVPFAALPFDQGLLVDRIAEFYLPNLGLAARLGQPESRLPHAPTVAAFGEIRASKFGPLPGARAELEYLARRFKAVTHRDTHATPSALADAADDVDILHLAVHGIRGDFRRPSYLELGGSKGPTVVTAAEVVTSRIPAGLVFLAACESAGTKVNPSDEVPEALDRAFLLAGAKAVVSARWALADRPARLFVETFYEELATRGRLGALMAARQAVRTRSSEVSQLTRGLVPAQDAGASPDHPYFWASFMLSGEHL